MKFGRQFWVAFVVTVLTHASDLRAAKSLSVAFNQSMASRFTEPYRHLERQGYDFEARLLQEIAQAHKSVWVAVQELRLPRLAQLLAAKKAAGLDVRIVLENTYDVAFSRLSPEQVAALSEYDRGKYAEFLRLADALGDGDTQASAAEQLAADAVAMLRDARVPLLNDTADGTKGSGLMHHKFVVIDGTRTLVTSANFTTSDFYGDFDHPSSRGNTNAFMSFDSREIAELFGEEFSQMWGNGTPRSSRFGVKKTYRPARTVRLEDGTQVTIQFSPQSKKIEWEQSSNGLIARVLRTAHSSVDFALFVFSEQKIADAMEGLAGLRVRGLVEPSFAYRDYSEMLDLMGVALRNKKCGFETGNRPWTNPSAEVGIPLLPEGDKLHHKFAVVDGRRVIFGSHNWSEAAGSNNDETLLVIENSEVAARFAEEFERLRPRAILGVQPWLARRIADTEAACKRRARFKAQSN
jgi:phosphatidylserine/phosphatidylglycerophosphate/cardiolipin synthase-like enzyme